MTTTRSTFTADGATFAVHDVRAAAGPRRFAQLPYVARVLAENILRNIGRAGVTRDVLDALLDPAVKPDGVALPLSVPRLIVPDSSGIPVLMDLAALRAAVARAGGDAGKVTSSVPIAFVVDHSLQVDHFASADAERRNLAREFERNAERYRFLKWAEGAFPSVETFPPGTGIIHQVHLEQVAQVVLVDRSGPVPVAHPDFALGGDSHTPMINALGVLGWGVGGIEIETVALGEPYVLPKPEIVGVRLAGAPKAGLAFTDVALAMTEILRRAGVVGALVEFLGPAALHLAVPDRATLANMAPEYGATTGFWPVDEATLAYLRLTGRSAGHVALIEAHARASGLFRASSAPDPVYDRIVEVDLSAVGRSIAGPGKPHNRQSPATVAASFASRLAAAAVDGRSPPPTPSAQAGGEPPTAASGVPDGAIAIAAITSCTNTANPRAMIQAGLLARNAAARGLQPAPWVKTSLAPGSRAVSAYLARAGLLGPLEQLGFHVVGYGCTSCGGKAGPVKPEVAAAVEREGRRVAAVLSGNRNFDGRVHRLVNASYLMAPALVVAYALKGRIDGNIETDAIGRDRDGRPVRLADVWPDDREIDTVISACVTPDLFAAAAHRDAGALELWDAIDAPRGELFAWDPASHYIVEPPFFAAAAAGLANGIAGARILGIYEDGLTTDHVSPGGEIPPESPAGRYLIANGIAPSGFNSYVGRRGNHHVLARGTYANVRIRNRMVPEREGWWTRVWPEGEIATVYEAAERYRARATPLVVLGGRDFGSGSSRDWAAKGPALLGVRAVIARSFERIHRSNLIGVGILPLLLDEGESVESLRLDGSESLELGDLPRCVSEGHPIEVAATRRDGRATTFQVRCDARSAAEIDLLQRGGVFQAALAKAMTASSPSSPGE